MIVIKKSPHEAINNPIFLASPPNTSDKSDKLKTIAPVAIINICLAISIYVSVAILKKQLKLDASLYTILQILSLTLFEKAPLLQVLTDYDYRNNEGHFDNQLLLFNL